MNDVKVSVIIPAYNAAKTVEATVRNVMSSTIPISVWVVDDGSTDTTGIVLDHLAEEFASTTSQPSQSSTLTVIHQDNQGAYAARLNALKRIGTPYFGFVDADDTVEPTMFGELLAFAETNKCDVVQCGVVGVDPDIELGTWYSAVLNGRDSVVLEGRTAVESQFIKPHLEVGQGSSFIWNKLYRNQYDFGTFATFDHLTNYDDMIFNFQFFAHVSRFGVLKRELYHYTQTDGSVTHSYGARQLRDFRACYRFRRQIHVPSRHWYLVNLRNAVITVLRSSMPFVVKIKWLFQLLGRSWC